MVFLFCRGASLSYLADDLAAAEMWWMGGIRAYRRAGQDHCSGWRIRNHLPGRRHAADPDLQVTGLVLTAALCRIPAELATAFTLVTGEYASVPCQISRTTTPALTWAARSMADETLIVCQLTPAKLAWQQEIGVRVPQRLAWHCCI